MIVTSEAVEKLKEVLEENGETQASLRVIAVPGETGGIQYMMSMEQESQQGDTVMTLDGLNFLVDEDSAPFLEEATIDYMEDFPGQDSSSATLTSLVAAAVAALAGVATEAAGVAAEVAAGIRPLVLEEL